jgi:hypothetical protein
MAAFPVSFGGGAFAAAANAHYNASQMAVTTGSKGARIGAKCWRETGRWLAPQDEVVLFVMPGLVPGIHVFFLGR